MAEHGLRVQYADAGGLSIAYSVLGDGPFDVVWVQGLSGHLEVDWENPFMVHLWRRLASFSRLIRFDKRGTGLSDRTVGSPTLEERMDDVRAVMDAAGSERAALIGNSEGGPMSILFAATYPERTTGLVLLGTLARVRPDVDYPLGNLAQLEELRDLVSAEWGTGSSLRLFAPELFEVDAAREFAARRERASGTPRSITAILDTLVDLDVRSVVGSLKTPTLVVHAERDNIVPIANGRWLADHIEGARFVSIPGRHSAFDVDLFADEVEAFLTGHRSEVNTERVLATVLFSDISDSTKRATEMGDQRWRQLLDRHDHFVRQEVADLRGTLVKSTGDGALATFDGPARAVSCAQRLRDCMHQLDLDVRFGIHVGEIELRGEDIGGIAVHIASRVLGRAEPGQVLVSRTVVDLVVGSGIEFTPMGEHELKGVPGSWQLYAAS